MTLLQGILSGLVGVAAIFFLFNLYLFWRSRQSLYAALALACLGMLLYIPCNILLYTTTVPTVYLSIVRVQMYGTALFFISIIAIYVSYLQFPTHWPIYVYAAVFSVFLAIRTMDPMVMYSEFEGLLPYTLLWGEQIWLPVTSSSLLGWMYVLTIFSTYAVIATIAIIQFRRGFRGKSTLALFALALLFLMTVHDAVVYGMGLRWLFLAELGFIILISVLELAVAEDLLRVNLLAEKNRQLTEELEQRVVERTAQLEAANKELEAFSYSVSHDLRAPLRAMMGFAKILEDDFAEDIDPLARGFLRKIIASGYKMNELINDLLDFSRLGRESLQVQRCDLNEIVWDVVDSLSHETARRRIEWVLAELPFANVDAALIRQVFANLIGNAVKYTNKRQEARIEIGSFLSDGVDVYFVRDNGVGFDMQYADKLFGVFQRLHRDEDFEGTGIGLATVQRIIQRHSGRIWVEAEVDKGATFFFTLR